MKKFLSIVLISVFAVVLVSSDRYLLRSEKIIFEINSYCSLSTEEEIEKELEDVNNITLQIKLDYDDFNYAYEDMETASNEEIEAYRTSLREAGAQYHYNNNLEFSNEFEKTTYDNKYISKYTPYVEYQYSKDEFVSDDYFVLRYISNCEYVDLIYVEESAKQYQEQIINTIYQVGAEDYINNNEGDGTGINVGILEDGVMDKNHPNIAGSNFLIRDEWYFIETVEDHSTIVGSIIGGNTGIAKGARLLSVEMAGTPNSEIDWLLDNNVHIINMSFAVARDYGEYNSTTAYMDYVVKTYKVTCVAAAGNNNDGNYKVGNPGLGYNVITVGAFSGRFYRLPYSSYVEVTGPDKPTLCAPGSSLAIPNFSDPRSGTSIATAVTSGLLALVFEEYPDLKVNPEKAVSLITATAIPYEDYPRNKTNNLNDMIGAGLVNFQNMMDCYYCGRIIKNTLRTENMVFYDVPLRLEVGETLSFAVFWLANVASNSTSVSFTDYDIRLFDNDGNVVATSLSSKNNLETLLYTATSPGYYNVRFLQYGSVVSSEVERLSYSYKVYGPGELD